MIEGRSGDAFPAAKSFLYQEPRLMRSLLGKIARATARYLKAQVAAGASAVQLFDTWCGELSRRDYEEFALPATQLLIAELGLRGVPLILYTKNSTHLLAEVARAGADVLSVDWRVDLAPLRRELGARVALQGNVDPCILPGPRYTSYPTAPVWNESFGPDDFERVLADSNAKGAPVSLYMHIPFCESLCLFCACNVVIQKDKKVAPPYLEILKKEIEQFSRRVSRCRPVVQFHWAGGTPTYF